MTETEIVALSGAAGGSLERVRWRNRRAGRETEAAIRNVSLFVGADPATEWLQGCGVAVDKAGFMTTGAGRACSIAPRIVHPRPARGRRSRPDRWLASE